MKRTTYFVCLVNILVQGDFNSNFMLRNPSYDNRGTNAVHVISSSNSNGRLACASQCTAWGECKSVMFNMNTNECQLLSIHMGDQSDAGPHSSMGWLYYEKEFGKYFLTFVPMTEKVLVFPYFSRGNLDITIKQYFHKLLKIW